MRNPEPPVRGVRTSTGHAGWRLRVVGHGAGGGDAGRRIRVVERGAGYGDAGSGGRVDGGGP